MTYFELQQLLKQYHTFIYTGDKCGDLDLIQTEIKELYQLGLIDEKIYRDANITIMQERRIEKLKRTQ
ncbi:YqgQ family protein [Evansella cellulosilytica]|uniref:DUF910 family protein n=1 Tax=Evansella cellulosilytica (strain ATCC 21833 / DSM 2522 / FERM P-1141 / JCM 9156 / N-4) TaxID=649639 RepID=E6TWX7_EVAC2|nr:YqgQ family protein [Evansella cellulosilytica]ADU29927.1 protein of unknown function DUF910 [Evansella cellulosilytica DSM 2522]